MSKKNETTAVADPSSHYLNGDAVPAAQKTLITRSVNLIGQGDLSYAKNRWTIGHKFITGMAADPQRFTQKWIVANCESINFSKTKISRLISACKATPNKPQTQAEADAFAALCNGKSDSKTRGRKTASAKDRMRTAESWLVSALEGGFDVDNARERMIAICDEWE